MAIVTLTSYASYTKIYPAKLGGTEYIQCTAFDATHIAITDTFPSSNDDYSCTVYINDDIVEINNILSVSIQFLSPTEGIFTANATTKSDATIEDTATFSAIVTNVYELDKVDYNYLNNRITFQFRNI